MNRSEIVKKYDAYYKAKPNKWAGDYRNEFAFQAISEALGGKEPRSVTDVGCGSGHTLAYFIKQWPNAKVRGLDVSGIAVGLARVRAPQAEVFESFMDGEGIPSSQVVTLLGVAEHVEDPNELKVLNSLVWKNGLIYFEMPNCIGYPFSTKDEGYRQLNGGSRQFEWHLRRETWVERLTGLGFTIVKSLDGPTPQTEFVFICKPGVSR